MEKDPEFIKTIEYMMAHWPSEVEQEWRVGLNEYPAILEKVLADFTVGRSQKRHFIRIAGLSGSGKTTQLLPAAEVHCEKQGLSPVLVAARRFVEYHPHYQEILDFYGAENLRKMTDEFSTIMLFMTLRELIRRGYDIILDVTLLDVAMEQILVKMLEGYQMMMLIIAVSPEVAERQLGKRGWRHTRETEQEFIRATDLALDFYASECPKMRIGVWNVFDLLPVYDGEAKGVKDIFKKYAEMAEIPEHDEAKMREAKIKYFL